MRNVADATLPLLTFPDGMPVTTCWCNCKWQTASSCKQPQVVRPRGCHGTMLLFAGDIQGNEAVVLVRFLSNYRCLYSMRIENAFLSQVSLVLARQAHDALSRLAFRAA